MPYTVDSEDLPDKVKKFTQHEKEIWVAAFNSSYKSCIDDGGKTGDCESSGFAIAYSAVKKYQEKQRQRRESDEYILGQLCPYHDCCHDLAIPKIGWYKCGACERVFYADDTDSDYEDYHCYREEKVPDSYPEKPDEIPVAKDLGASWATPDEDEESRTMNKSKFRLWIEGIINSVLKQRAVKDVESWDGAASNYKDAAEYCAACLIDTNSAAGRDEKVIDHCMLPVREPGDSADTYVRQAVHAAAGGHGISQVKRPDDVPEEDWNAAVKAAANKLISAYDEMGEEAPESCYELAGKEMPKKEDSKTRATVLDEAYWTLCTQVQAMDNYAWVNGLYLEGESMFAVISAAGKLYRSEVSIINDMFQVGQRDSWVEVKLDFPPVSGGEGEVYQSRVTIKRQADGKFRWFSISASAVLNRVGEIDSRALFDSFIAEAEKTGEYPIRQFFHAGGKFRTGQADFLGRDENLLITSGIYDDTDIARAEVRARTDEPEYWGDSIGFDPTSEPAKVRAGDGITVLAYDAGILREISTLPEEWAASWYTATPTLQEVDRMLTDKQREAFVKLMGSEEEADKWLTENAATRNREIEDKGLVTRTNVDEPEIDPEADEHDFVIDEAAFTELVSRVGQGLTDPIQQAVTAALKPFQDQVTELRGSLDGLKADADKRLKALESDDAEKRKTWLEDAPKITLRQTVRPRKPAPTIPEPDDDEDSSAIAESVLAGIPDWGPKSK